MTFLPCRTPALSGHRLACRCSAASRPSRELVLGVPFILPDQQDALITYACRDRPVGDSSAAALAGRFAGQVVGRRLHPHPEVLPRPGLFVLRLGPGHLLARRS